MPKRFRVAPTRPQTYMIILMSVAFGALLLWTIPELMGVFSQAAEDTYSEWVFDLPLWGVAIVVVLHAIAGLLLIGSAWHFLEGWGRRRRIEQGKSING